MKKTLLMDTILVLIILVIFLFRPSEKVDQTEMIVLYTSTDAMMKGQIDNGIEISCPNIMEYSEGDNYVMLWQAEDTDGIEVGSSRTKPI